MAEVFLTTLLLISTVVLVKCQDGELVVNTVCSLCDIDVALVCYGDNITFTCTTTDKPLLWTYMANGVYTHVAYDQDDALPISVGKASIINITTSASDLYTAVVTIDSVTVNSTFQCNGMSGLPSLVDISVSGITFCISTCFNIPLGTLDPPSSPSNLTFSQVNSTAFTLTWSPSSVKGNCTINYYIVNITPGDIAIMTSTNEIVVSVNDSTSIYHVTVSATDSVLRPLHTLNNSTLTIPWNGKILLCTYVTQLHT